jgi:hypothetical protein
MPTRVLDGSADADGEVDFGRDGLAGAADLALHGQPAVVADGAGGGQFRAEGGGQLLDDREVGFFLDAAAYGDEDGC